MCSHMDFVDDSLKWFFRRLGRQIGTTPLYFIIVPLLLTALAATGFQQITHEADPEYLFSPLDGDGKTERDIMESLFPMNYSDFDPGRVSRGGRFGRLLITAKDNSTILQKRVFDEIILLNSLVENVTIEWKGELLSYQDICATWQGQCWSNDVLKPGKYMEEIESGESALTYPLWFDPDTFQRITFPFFTGGIELNEDFTIKSIYVLSLNYFLNSATPEHQKLGAIWEDAYLETVGAQSFNYIKVARFSSLTLERELEENTNSVLPYFSLNMGVMVAFCIFTCMMTDWVKSKPILGLLGIISAILATLASFGFVIYLGVPFTGINLAAPFLMLGIGIDDTFVMIGAWRRTSIADSVPERMSQTFHDAAVSITITSLTDMLSFWIGVITPFPSVKIFCVYTGAAVAFTYLWHITLFGAFMALSGYAEKDNRHAITCMRVESKSQSKGRNFLYRAFCSGGINKQDPLNPIDNRDNGLMVFFRDRVAGAINTKWVKVLILLTFCVYISTAIWGMSQLKEGLERRRLARFDSYSVDYYNLEDGFFREYPYRINVVISGHLDYSDLTVQAELEELMQQLENTTYIDPAYTESWLRDFTDFVERNKDYDPIDISNEANFIQALDEIYLGSGHTHFRADIKMSNASQAQIVGARFLIQGSKIHNAVEEKIFVEQLRAVCDASKYNVTVFHPYFIYFDQFIMVLPTTIQCVTVAAIVMMIISLIFIPNPICSLWVAFSIISIEIGVVGYMTLWDVYLDSISMINLIMCIGFSVDFSAHISYHFMSRVDMTPEERVRDSLFALGLPISQGAISTILGVLALILAPSYIFVTFFKMVTLVIILGALHGIFLLPVLLSMFGPGVCDKRSNADTSDVIEGGRYLHHHHHHHHQQPQEMKIPRPSTISTISGSINGGAAGTKEDMIKSRN